jgi:hypothetical protein
MRVTLIVRGPGFSGRAFHVLKARRFILPVRSLGWSRQLREGLLLSQPGLIVFLGVNHDFPSHLWMPNPTESGT